MCYICIIVYSFALPLLALAFIWYVYYKDSIGNNSEVIKWIGTDG